MRATKRTSSADAQILISSPSDHSAALAAIAAGTLSEPESGGNVNFEALREAGLIRQRHYGLERRSRVRTEDLDVRFPSLIALVKAWESSPPIA